MTTYRSESGELDSQDAGPVSTTRLRSARTVADLSDRCHTTDLEWAQFRPVVDTVVQSFARKMPRHVSLGDLKSAAWEGVGDILRRRPEGVLDKDGAIRDDAWGYFLQRIRGAVVDELRRFDWLSRRSRWASRSTNQGSPWGPSAAATFVSLDAEPALLEERGAVLLDPEHSMEEGGRWTSILAALGELSGRDRQVLELRYLSGLTFREIALQLGVSGARVSQIHGRALGQLRLATT